VLKGTNQQADVAATTWALEGMLALRRRARLTAFASAADRRQAARRGRDAERREGLGGGASSLGDQRGDAAPLAGRAPPRSGGCGGMTSEKAALVKRMPQFTRARPPNRQKTLYFFCWVLSGCQVKSLQPVLVFQILPGLKAADRHPSGPWRENS